jgi:hypothetical protein
MRRAERRVQAVGDLRGKASAHFDGEPSHIFGPTHGLCWTRLNPNRVESTDTQGSPQTPYSRLERHRSPTIDHQNRVRVARLTVCLVDGAQESHRNTSQGPFRCSYLRAAFVQRATLGRRQRGRLDQGLGLVSGDRQAMGPRRLDEAGKNGENSQKATVCVFGVVCRAK